MRTEADIEKIVERVREKLGLRDADLFDAIEMMSVRVPRPVKDFSFQVWPDSSLPEGNARYDPDGPKVCVRQSVYDGAARGNPRDVFTIVHELGHLVLNHDGVRLRSVGRDKRASCDTQIAAEEKEAHLFAATFIAPSYMMNPGLSIEEISKRFNMSAQASTKRKEEFDREWRRSNRIERPLPANVVDFMAEFEKRR